MDDNPLKRQFDKNDVTRIRNLVKGKSGERITTGVGYTKSTSHTREEGEIWEEGGKTWTIREGIRENVTKLDAFRSVSVPLFCPKCTGVMNKQLDPDYYKAYGECVNCRTKFETQHKLNGTWEEYRRQEHNREIDFQIKEYKAFYTSLLEEGSTNFVTEDGDVEKWSGGLNKEKLKETMEEGIVFLEGLKK